MAYFFIYKHENNTLHLHDNTEILRADDYCSEPLPQMMSYCLGMVYGTYDNFFEYVMLELSLSVLPDFIPIEAIKSAVSFEDQTILSAYEAAEKLFR